MIRYCGTYISFSDKRSKRDELKRNKRLKLTVLTFIFSIMKKNLSKICVSFKKVWERMTSRGKRRGTSDQTSNLSLPVTKKARQRATSNTDSKDPACFQRENEELSRKLEVAREDFNELQLDKDCRVSGNKTTGGETSTFNGVTQSSYQSDATRILEAKLQSCQSQLTERDLKIARLENSVIEAEQVRVELEKKVEKMQEQLCKELEGCGSYADGGATPFLLESTLKAVQMSASSFTKVFLEYSKSWHNVDVNSSLERHFQNTYLTRPGHVTYLLKAWTFETLFKDFENESFSCAGVSIFLDHTEGRAKCFQCFEQLQNPNASVLDPSAELRFQQFFRQKLRHFLLLWKSADQVKASSPLNLSSATVENPAADDSKKNFIENFRSLAKGVWMLHKLSFSFQTRADIFRVRQQTDLNAEYMDSVVSLQDDDQFVSKVGFMICPGFRLKRSIVKCQVYLAGKSFNAS